MSFRMASRLGGVVALILLAWGAAATVGFTRVLTESADMATADAPQSETLDSSDHSSSSAPANDAQLHDATGCDGAAPAATPLPSQQTTAVLQATFHLCGQADPQAERAIEQLIGGRGFSARLVSQADGCADLTITVSPSSVMVSSGQQSTNLVVSTGARGASRTISVRIVSENGQTRVSFAPTASGG